MKPHAGKEIHVVLDNLSTHATPEVKAWLAANPNVTFHFTPTGSSWLNMIEIWFGIITRQSIRRGTFTSVNTLIVRIRDYITHWNTDAKPFTSTTTTDQIPTNVRWVQTSVKQLVDNNAKQQHQDHATLVQGAYQDYWWTGRSVRALETVTVFDVADDRREFLEYLAYLHEQGLRPTLPSHGAAVPAATTAGRSCCPDLAAPPDEHSDAGCARPLPPEPLLESKLTATPRLCNPDEVGLIVVDFCPVGSSPW